MAGQTTKARAAAGFLAGATLFSWCASAAPAATSPWPAPADIAWLASLGANTMWGGDDAWFTPDGRLVLQATARNEERRIVEKTDPVRFDELRRTVAGHDFSHAEMRPSELTDAMGTLLCVGLADGRVVARHIVGSTADSHFNAVEKAIDTRLRAMRNGEAVYSGAYQPDWQPPGFPSRVRATCYEAASALKAAQAVDREKTRNALAARR
jgi:hypothetical protein